VFIPTIYGDPPQPRQPQTPPVRPQPLARSISRSELNLHNTVRRLWMDNAALTRMVINSDISNLPSFNATVARLQRNADDMATAIRPIYGDANATRLGKLIRNHIHIGITLLNAIKTGNNEVAATAEREWNANADELATFLNQINPYIPHDDFSKLLSNYLLLTSSQAQARLRREYDSEISFYDQGINQALAMADLMSSAIARQFPNMFM
jgi:adenine-specific DNA methylase